MPNSESPLNDYTLTVRESEVALGIAGASSESGREYVRVKEIADYLEHPSESVRTYLNKLRQVGIAESRKPKIRIHGQPDLDPREKIWTLTYGVDVDGFDSLIQDHPEIEEQIAEDDIHRLLTETNGSNVDHKRSSERYDTLNREVLDPLMNDYPEVIEFFGGREEVYEFFNTNNH